MYTGYYNKNPLGLRGALKLLYSYTPVPTHFWNSSHYVALGLTT